jgi:hypothetical protein
MFFLLTTSKQECSGIRLKKLDNDEYIFFAAYACTKGGFKFQSFLFKLLLLKPAYGRFAVLH